MSTKTERAHSAQMQKKYVQYLSYQNLEVGEHVTMRLETALTVLIFKQSRAGPLGKTLYHVSQTRAILLLGGTRWRGVKRLRLSYTNTASSPTKDHSWHKYFSRVAMSPRGRRGSGAKTFTDSQNIKIIHWPEFVDAYTKDKCPSL